MRNVLTRFLPQVSFFRKKLYIPFFFLSVFLIKLPPFYFIPLLKSQFLTTHSMAVYLAAIAFIFFVANLLITRDTNFERKNKVLLVIFVSFLIFQSLSLIPAVNVTSFLGEYRNYVFSGFFLFLALDLKEEKDKFFWIFILTAFVNTFYQLFLFFYPSLFKNLANIFIYSSHLDLININLQRGRIFIETYDEITTPFLILLVTKKKYRKVAIILLSLIFFTTLISNFRTRILMLLFAFFASIFVIWRGKRLLKVGVLVLFVALAIFSEIVATSTLGFSFLDRLSFQDQTQDVETVDSRLQRLQLSAQIGLSHPILGVGLGNYYDYLPNSKKFTLSFYNWKQKEFSLASQDPHDILAKIVSENGLVGIIFFVGMLGYFGKKDIERLLKDRSDTLTNSYIVSFWTLFIYSLLNPTTTLPYNSLFWILRALA